MNTATLRSKRVVLPTITVVAVLAGGGVAWSASASEDVARSERDRVADAAVRAVGGTVVDVETSDDLGEAYEVELRATDGTEIDLSLDKDLNVVGKDVESIDDDTDDADDDGRGAPDPEDRALSSAERASAEAAARSSVRGGTVLEVEAGDDGYEAYEVEVVDSVGTEWDVELDADFTVLRKTVDD